MKQILEGSRAIALTIKNIEPSVISAYPITPQTHIVEDLAKFKADGKVKYEYVRAESEFAAASIIEGASASGERVYSATSSQGILLMTEVLFNIAGMRLPIVITCANRGVSAPITIWNDHQDAMTIRDSGWIMLFAENHEEAVIQHILAYKIAEQTELPVMVNIDGFILTHSYEAVKIPNKAEILKYLPKYKPTKKQKLDPENPITMGAFATPADYQQIREQLHNDLIKSINLINKEYKKLIKTINIKSNTESDSKYEQIDNGLIEFYAPKKSVKTLLVCMGSLAGTVKQVIEKSKKSIGLLKIKTFRPFPEKMILKTIQNINPKNIAILDKSISLGHTSPLTSNIKAILQNKIPNISTNSTHPNVRSFVVGLGGRDVTSKMIEKIIKDTKNTSKTKFI